jgi:GTP cyclohydrolase I
VSGSRIPPPDGLTRKEEMAVAGTSLSRILEITDKLFPFTAAEPWDNCGIQIGDPNRIIHAIAFSLDPTPETVAFAVQHECDLLICHHPLFLEPVRSVTPENITGQTLLAAARSGVDIVSLHTNLDAAQGGLNDHLAALLHLENVVTPLPAACARFGRLSTPMGLFSFADKIAHDLAVGGVKVISTGDRGVETVFCVSGSGMGYLKEALAYSADVMVTGDVRYHAAREALARGMAVIDAGHFGLEKVAASLLLESLGKEFTQHGIEMVLFSCDIETEPCVYITGKEGFSVERTTATS